MRCWATSVSTVGTPEMSMTRPLGLRRLSLGHESFAVLYPLALLGVASYPLLFVGPQLRSTLPSRRPRGPTLCVPLRSL
jgi:hypothetical protein